jgi:UDP-N-acetylmuramoyl-tripeptide--D-alanyl-D-alanine ligase
MSLQSAFTTSAISYALLPLALIVANLGLVPYEARVQHGYEAEATGKLQQIRPFIVGITGSYGKSSTKSMLGHILQFQGPTLAASGSINTLMGLTRHIRDELVPGHQFMVVEMGAFKRGSIRRLCRLAPPSAGIITAVGDMHLERFGSTDEIIKAKSELAFALSPGSVLVVNADSPGALKIADSATHCRVLLYGERSERSVETRLEQIEFSKAGTTFVLRTADRAFTCFTPLLGRPIVLNLAGAFTLAAALGVDRDLIVAAFRTLKPVANRLEVVEERGVTWIRDAYNSNQFGFRAALEVAAALPVVRRFLATPGVIELGPEQFEVNRTLAREAAAVCETTMIVAETNREAFAAGFRDAGREARLVAVPGRADAFRWIGDHVQEGDLVILENDLPDLYERSVGLFWGSR